VFGGKTLTATDVTVGAGVARFGDTAGAVRLPRHLVRAALDTIHAKIEDAVDRIKTEAGDLPLLAVGGGEFLVPDRPAGISQVLGVPHGSARTRLGRRSPRSAVKPTRSIATSAATRQSLRPKRKRGDEQSAPGPTRTSLETVDVEDTPFAYLPGNALRVWVRVRVRVATEMAGHMAQNGSSSVSQ
jgi:hypothetical protein